MWRDGLRLPASLPGSLLLLTLWGLSAASVAHIPSGAGDNTQTTGWIPGFLSGAFNEMLSVALLAGYWLLYLVGSWRHPAHKHQMLLFHVATIVCVLALIGPLDKWAATNAAAHMSQHMIFIVVVAPLWVLSRPLPQLAAGGGKLTAVVWRPALRLTRYPLLIAYLHGAVIWFWHMPYFYLLALDNSWWHSVEHWCFLVSAGLFWWAVFTINQRNSGWALLAVLFTLMHTGFLGALLTFAQQPLYGASRPLEDQQLAGLIMWVAGSFPYMMAAMWIGYRWYLHLLRRMNAAVA